MFEVVKNDADDANKPSFSIPETLRNEREALKDYIFNKRMEALLLQSFIEAMEEVADDPEFVDEFIESLVNGDYSESEVHSVLSIPHELRDRQFKTLLQRAHELGSVQSATDEFVTKLSKYGFGLGYHTSPFEINPAEDGSWTINASEQDHRDSDLSRAYYSTKYRHLYKKKDPKFIYVVRTEPDTHKTDGNWSRASSLSVVDKIPIEDVIQYVEQTYKENAARSEEDLAA